GDHTYQYSFPTRRSSDLVQTYPKETGIKIKEIEGSEEEKEKHIKFTEATLELQDGIDPLVEDTIKVIRLIKEIQSTGSERAVQRFIISNCQKASDILGLMQLFLWEGWTKKDLTMDFVPLFETV